MPSALLHKALGVLIDRLSESASDEEAKSGWTTETKSQFATWFRNKRHLLTQGEWAPDHGLVRSLDMFGIGDGDLYQEVLRINRELRDDVEGALG